MKTIRNLINYWRFGDELRRLQEDSHRHARNAEYYLALALPHKALESYAKSNDCSEEIHRILDQRLKKIIN